MSMGEKKTVGLRVVISHENMTLISRKIFDFLNIYYIV